MSDRGSTIEAVIDRIKERMREVSADFIYEDEFIYDTCLDIRRVLLYRELNKKTKRPAFTYKHFCMPLEKSSEIPCECVPEHLNCIVLRSIYDMPKYMYSNNKEYVNILALDGRTEFSLKQIRAGVYNKYSRVNEDGTPYATMMNERLYIIGYPNNKLKGVQIQMIPDDPASLSSINLCDGECGRDSITDTSCYDPKSDTFNIDGHLLDAMIEEVVTRLTSKKEREDITNDRTATPAEQNI